MTNRCPDLAPSDLNDASADLYERRQAAQEAVRTAVRSADLLTLVCDELRSATGSQAYLAQEAVEHDARETGRLLDRAARLLDAVDPLADADNSADYDALLSARADWHACLCALDVDLLALRRAG